MRSFSLLLICSVSISAFGCFSSRVDTSDVSTVERDNRNGIPVERAVDQGNQAKVDRNVGNIAERPSSMRYVGCWSGMHGGRLKITEDRIADLGSHEQSTYKPLAKREADSGRGTKGLETGEEYTLEADKNAFRKSFLSQIIRLSFLSDGTVGISSYESKNDLDLGKIKGQGLFGKVACN